MAAARYAVLIGSSTFPEESQLQPLNAPERDVDDMATVLRAQNRGGFNEVLALKNRPHHEIISNIQRTLNRASREDLVILYYSGHGKLNRAGRLYLTASNTVLDELESSAIAVSGIRDFVDVSQSQRVMIILDCCFSGAVGEVFSKGSIDDQLQIATSEGRGTYIMTASTGIQTAQEKETDQHSIFTKHLIDGIETGDADANGDGVITADELYDYVYKRVRKESHQEPTRWGVDLRGHFVISNSGREPRRERAEALRTYLLQLANENRITDEVLYEALEIIKRPTENLSPLEQARDALLDALRDKTLEAASFLVQWIQVEPLPSPGPITPPVKPLHEEVKANVSAKLTDRPKVEAATVQLTVWSALWKIAVIWLLGKLLISLLYRWMIY